MPSCGRPWLRWRYSGVLARGSEAPCNTTMAGTLWATWGKYRIPCSVAPALVKVTGRVVTVVLTGVYQALVDSAATAGPVAIEAIPNRIAKQPLIREFMDTSTPLETH